jgi:hypothetical protein
VRDDTYIEYSKRAPTHRQLEGHDWWVASRHLLTLLWCGAFMAFTAPAYEQITHAISAAVCVSLVAVGSVTAAYGRLTFRHKSFELWGLSAVVFGWASFFVLVMGQAVLFDRSLVRGGVLALVLIALSTPLERWLFLLVSVLQDAGVVRTGVRIRRKRR